MTGEPRREGGDASMAGAVGPGDAAAPRFSRRQMIGRMSAVAAAGAVAWVTPEILTAKPANGATLSGATEPATLNAVSNTSTSAPLTKLANGLAFTGMNLQRDAEIGVALAAGGWAMHHWASRAPEAAAASAIAAASEPAPGASAPTE